MLLAIGIGAAVALVFANFRAAKRGARHITLHHVEQAGRFIRGSGGDGWGGPSNGSVWDQPRKGGW
jgi:hypothetical protein